MWRFWKSLLLKVGESNIVVLKLESSDLNPNSSFYYSMITGKFSSLNGLQLPKFWSGYGNSF